MQTALVIILVLAILGGAVRWPLWMGISRRRHYASMGLDDDGSRYLLYPCPFRKSYPDVLVVQPSQDGNSDDPARPLDGPW
jgi:hypothetical protein